MSDAALPTPLAFDPLSILGRSSPAMLALSILLIVAAALVWFIAALRQLQISRWRRAEGALQVALRGVPLGDPAGQTLAQHPNSLGAALITDILAQAPAPAALDAETDHALLRQQHAAYRGITLLGSIATTAPLAGLFGTVYGIMEAFSRIGQAKSSALSVVAPSIGDALLTTALGLFAAIPGVLLYNHLTRQLEDLLDDVRLFARAWLSARALPPRSPEAP